jgi:hypothetical protein
LRFEETHEYKDGYCSDRGQKSVPKVSRTWR